MTTLIDGWKSYRMLLPIDAHEAQLCETEQAFYAGCTHALSMLIELAAKDPTDDGGTRQLEAWHQECRERVRAIIQEAERRWGAGSV